MEPWPLTAKCDEGRGGRKRKLGEQEREELVKLYWTQNLSLRTLAEMFGVSRMTVWRATASAPVPEEIRKRGAEGMKVQADAAEKREAEKWRMKEAA